MGAVLQNGSANAAAELIAIEGRVAGLAYLSQRCFGKPVVVVERRVAPVFKGFAMHLVGAAARHHIDHTTGKQALLRFSLIQDHVKFLNSALGEVLAGLALLCPCVGDAVHREAVSVKASASGDLHVVVEGT